MMRKAGERAQALYNEWADAFSTALENSTSQQTDVDGDVQLQVRGKNKYGIEVYETSEEIKKLPIKERQKIFLAIMSKEFRGRTAKFVRNGHAYYAQFDYRDINKNIYGDKLSDKKGWKAKINAGADGNIFELVENSTYNGSKVEKGKLNVAHRGVNHWDYFIKTVQIDNTVYDLVANVRKKSNEQFVYSIQLNQNKKIEASPSLDSPNGVLNRMLNASNNTIPQESSSVKENISDTQAQARRVTKEQDTAYMDAVNRGDTETAQRMVDEAAKEAGYTIKAYHGTPNAEFTVFDKERVGKGIDQHSVGYDVAIYR